MAIRPPGASDDQVNKCVTDDPLDPATAFAAICVK